MENVPDAKVERDTDCLVKITSTNICGSDLHMYEGRTSVEEGKVLGHENLGTVVEIGSAVHQVKVGDMVCLPFNIACGYCENCESGYTGFCLTMNQGSAGAAYGYAEMGPYQGGQAEFLRVPYADFNCLVLPEGQPRVGSPKSPTPKVARNLAKAPGWPKRDERAAWPTGFGRLFSYHRTRTSHV